MRLEEASIFGDDMKELNLLQRKTGWSIFGVRYRCVFMRMESV